MRDTMGIIVASNINKKSFLIKWEKFLDLCFKNISKCLILKLNTLGLFSFCMRKDIVCLIKE